MNKLLFAVLCLISVCPALVAQEETFAPLPKDAKAAPANFEELWQGFDPRSEELETEVLSEWEEDGVLLKVVRFRIGVFKGKPAKLAAVYGVPKSATEKNEKLPGLLQIHGGGQYADHRACLTNAKRGYATLSISWAGRISATKYRVNPEIVKLFWDNKTDDSKYKLTTDWGLLDAYHAPCRNSKNNFTNVAPAEWTLDPIDSPRNNPWFLCAIAARRGLTFLERQPNVDPDRLGVYGHSMGGKLTVMTSVDARVKACAPSCGGISDLYKQKSLYEATINDKVHLKHVSCPIFFLSPSNDFHGRIGDLPAAIDTIQSPDWRVTCSPHMNHKDNGEHAVATQLWFDEHLKSTFKTPATPESNLVLKTADGTPTFSVTPDINKAPVLVDVYYTQHGKTPETPSNHTHTLSRYWHHASAKKSDGQWTASLPLEDPAKPLWVYANVTYQLDSPITGAGYYYSSYTTDQFVVSSLVKKVTGEELAKNGAKASLQLQTTIEDFAEGWEKDWIVETGKRWALISHKIGCRIWAAPENGELEFQVRAPNKGKFVLMAGPNHGTEVEVKGGGEWQTIRLKHSGFHNFEKEALTSWDDIRSLKFCATEYLRRKENRRTLGGRWSDAPPELKNLRWVTPNE